MRIINTFGIIAVIFLMSSCDKNQRKINTLDGKWEITYATIEGVGPVYTDGQTLDFSSCKLKNEGYCNFTFEDFWNIEFVYGVYNVTHKGERMNMTFYFDDGDQPYSFNVIKLNDDKVILENIDAEDFTYSRLELQAVEY